MKSKPTTPAKSFLTRVHNKLKVIGRKGLGKRGKSIGFLVKLDKLTQFVTAYPMASEEQCRNWVIAKRDLLESIIAPFEKKWIQELNQLTNQPNA